MEKLSWRRFICLMGHTFQIFHNRAIPEYLYFTNNKIPCPKVENLFVLNLKFLTVAAKIPGPKVGNLFVLNLKFLTVSARSAFFPEWFCIY